MKKNYLSFDDLIFFSPYGSASTTVNTKQIENYEINYSQDGGYLTIEVPGFNKSNLTIEVEDNTLVVSGKRTYTVNGTTKTKTISEKYVINEGNASSIEATVEDGLLTIFIPNLKKQKKTKISIQ
jgi:HSP20 family protein